MFLFVAQDHILFVNSICSIIPFFISNQQKYKKKSISLSWYKYGRFFYYWFHIITKGWRLCLRPTPKNYLANRCFSKFEEMSSCIKNGVLSVLKGLSPVKYRHVLLLPVTPLSEGAWKCWPVKNSIYITALIRSIYYFWLFLFQRIFLF